MTTQPEALRLADALTADDFGPLTNEAAAELRRLASFNQQLMDEVARLNKALAEQPAQQEPSIGGVLFAVEEAIRNGDCPWQIESAFDEYEAERKAAQQAQPAREPDAWTDLTAYILQDDLHNRLTPRVVDIAYSAFMIGRSGKNKDNGGPCDWFNDTKPMVMEQLAKIRKDLAAQPAQPAREWVGLTPEEVQAAVYDENGCVVDYEDYASALEAKLKEKNT